MKETIKGERGETITVIFTDISFIEWLKWKIDKSRVVKALYVLAILGYLATIVACMAGTVHDRANGLFYTAIGLAACYRVNVVASRLDTLNEKDEAL